MIFIARSILFVFNSLKNLLLYPKLHPCFRNAFYGQSYENIGYLPTHCISCSSGKYTPSPLIVVTM